MKPSILFFATLFFILPNYTNGQSSIDKEMSFLYFLKVNNVDLNKGTYPYISSNLSCLSYYSSEFDKRNYDNIKNDEFKRNDYYSHLRKTLEERISPLSFKKEYCIFSQANFGEYNFSNKTFPITNIFSDCEFLKDRTMFDHKCQFSDVPITVGWVINRKYFDYSIQMEPSNAEALINKKKLSNGTINRVLQTKIVFTFVDEPYYVQTSVVNGLKYNGLEKNGFIIYVKRIELYDNGALVATLEPNENFEDPIHGFKNINGEDSYQMVTKDDQKIIFETKIVVNRTNGKPNGPVKYYDADGNLIRIIYCSYFFPNKIFFSGDLVNFVKKDGKTIPYSIMQFKNNHLEGYNIQFSSGDLCLKSVSEIDKDGKETFITKPTLGIELECSAKKVFEMPSPVQELIKKYDDENYYQYSDDKKESFPKEAREKEQLNSDSKKSIIDILCGTWVGDVSQGKKSYSVRLNCNSETSKFLIDYPSLHCSGYWNIDRNSDKSINFTEHILTGRLLCAEGGQIRIVLISNTQIEYDFLTSSKIVIKGVLTKQ